MIQGYRLAPNGLIPLNFSAASLDEMTRQLPDGFYTTFNTLTQGMQVLGLKTHLCRLYDPACALGLHPPVDEKELRALIAELAKQNLPDESRFRLILTKGNKTELYIGVERFAPLPKTIYENGVKVISANLARQDPRAKGTDFISQSAEQRKQVRGEIFEVLLTHRGRILEGMTSNFYAVVSGNVITAQNRILLGVTRRAVLRLAKGEGMRVIYRAPSLSERFDEAFLTSSSRGVVPIVSIDGNSVGRGRVGKWTKRLSAAYWAYVEKAAEEIER